MFVKVGHEIFDPNQEPVMIILTEKDKENIRNMHPSCSRYCVFPKSFNERDIEEFMEVDKKYLSTNK